MTAYSILDLTPIARGSNAAQALHNTLDLARHAESLGYRRYWISEHHNQPWCGSSATVVVMSHVAACTSTIRVGSGGIMLPNHPPLVVAEQFGTLESLHPGRIDLGVGRAPGAFNATTRALRRIQLADNATPPFPHNDEFAADIAELRSYFLVPSPGQEVRSIPGAGLQVPLWLLGSGVHGATLAAQLGLPFAFASHLLPDNQKAALDAYRSHFQPSPVLDRPYVMVCINLFAADSDEQAHTLFTSLQQHQLAQLRQAPIEVQPPVDSVDELWTPEERAQVDARLRSSIIGSPHIVERELAELVEQTGADELMFTALIHDHRARLHSFDIAARACRALPAACAV